MENNSYRYFGSLRALLALMVVLAHFSQAGGAPNQPIALGAIGFMLFFIISGFVITESLDLFYDERRIDFLKNRFLRIYPPYLFAVAVAAVVFFICVNLHKRLGVPYQPDILQPYALGNPKTLFANIFALIDPRNVIANNNYPIFVRTLWTIVIEIQFYLFMAAKSNNFTKLSIAISLYAIQLFFPFHSILRIIEFTPFFLIGAFIYHRKLLAAILAGIFSCYELTKMVGTSDPYWSVLVFAALVIIFYEGANFSWHNPRLKHIDVALGNLSYPLYLNHYTIIIALYAFREKDQMTMVIGIVISIAVAYAAHYFVEPPLKKIRDKIRRIRLE